MLAYILVEIYRLSTISQTVYNPNHIGLGHSGHVELEKAPATGHFFVSHWTVDTPANYSWEKQRGLDTLRKSHSYFNFYNNTS